VRGADPNDSRVHFGDIRDGRSAAIECIEPQRNLVALGRIAELSDEPRDYIGVLCSCFAYDYYSSYLLLIGKFTVHT
jgi:hypothetical protein